MIHLFTDLKGWGQSSGRRQLPEKGSWSKGLLHPVYGSVCLSADPSTTSSSSPAKGQDAELRFILLSRKEGFQLEPDRVIFLQKQTNKH